MSNLVYIYYPILAVILFWGAKISPRKQWNEGFMSLEQTKAIQGFSAICIMFHHISQKTCAPWLQSRYIRHGLDPFVNIGYFFVGIFLFCSGYGLYKSVTSKPNYLVGFFKKRILPLILAFYTTGWIFMIARVLIGEKIKGAKWIWYFTGLQMPNPNTWYVIAVPFFYFAFYLAFKFCKTEGKAIFMTCLVVFLYTLLGTFINHNDWWMRGEWWYNSVHLFSIGLLFGKFEKPIVEKIKKFYIPLMIIGFILVFFLYGLSQFFTATVSYYGEQWGADHVVLRRWVCLIAQMLASNAFVFFVFMANMKIKIGNKVLAFMGTLTLEFYLIHGLFIELFGFNFCDVAKSLYYIKNVALMVLVVAIPSVPAAMGLQKLHHLILSIGTKKEKK